MSDAPGFEARGAHVEMPRGVRLGEEGDGGERFLRHLHVLRRRRGVRASVVARTGPRAPNRRGFFLFREELHFFQRTTMENARAGRRERTDASGPTFLRQSLASSTAGPHSRPSIFAALTAATVAADPDPNVDVDCDGCSTRGIQEDVSMARCRSDGRSTSERHAIGECRVRRCERARGRLSASNEAMPRAGVRRGETCRRFFSFCLTFLSSIRHLATGLKKWSRNCYLARARATFQEMPRPFKTQVQKIPTAFHLTDEFPEVSEAGENFQFSRTTRSLSY